MNMYQLSIINYQLLLLCYFFFPITPIDNAV